MGGRHTYPKHNTSHIHRTPHENGKGHRERHSPHRSSEKTCKPTSRNPTRHSGQRTHARMDPMAAPHGDLDSTAPRPHRTCMIPHGNSPAHIPHTGESGNIHHEDKNPEHKAHRRQNEGKGITGEYPRPGGYGNSGINGEWILPRTTLTSPKNTDYTPRHHEVGRPHTPQSQQHTCTPRAPNKDTHREQHLPPQQSQGTKGTRVAGREPLRTHTTSQTAARSTYPPSRHLTSLNHNIIPHSSHTSYQQPNLAHHDPK